MPPSNPPAPGDAKTGDDLRWQARLGKLLGREPSSQELQLFHALLLGRGGGVVQTALRRSLRDTEPRRWVGAGVGTVAMTDGILVIATDASWREEESNCASGPAALARAMAKVVAIGGCPLAALHVIRAGECSSDTRAAARLRALIDVLAGYAYRAGIATLGGELSLDPQYADRWLVETMVLGIATRDPMEEAPLQAGNVTVSIHAPRAHPQDSVESSPEAWGKLIPFRAEAIRQEIEVVGLPIGRAGPLELAFELGPNLGLAIELGPIGGAAEPEAAWSDGLTERVLLATHPALVERLGDLAAKHGLESRVLGEITDTGHIQVRRSSGLTEIPLDPFVDLAVRGEPTAESEETSGDETHPGDLPEPGDYAQVVRQMVRAGNLCSRRALWERCDHFVGMATVLPGSGDAAVLFPDGPRSPLAVAFGGNPRFALLDPYVGCCIAVCEGVRSLLATGAQAVALAASPSFGGGGDPTLQWQVAQGLDGIRDAARAFGVPWTASQVGIWGSRESGASCPAPTVALVGRLASLAPISPWFKAPGDIVLLLGHCREEIMGTEFAALIHGRPEGTPPWVDFAAERRLQQVVLRATERNLLCSARSVARGGLALAVIASCCGTPEGLPGHGARIRIDEGMRPDAWLFGESQARMLVSVSRQHAGQVRDLATEAEVPVATIGEVTHGVLEFGELATFAVVELKATWEGALRDVLAAGAEP